MKKNTNIFIVGPLGSGKTTIGRGLAKILKRKFYDVDHVIAERVGVDIAWIFDIEGEEGFRKREAAILKELAELSNVVISTGGGAILLEENRKLLKENGFVIYLYTNHEQQLKRTRYNKQNRPLLLVKDVKSKIKEFGEKREPLYEEVADIKFTTGNKPIKSAIKEIFKQLPLVK
jgi:shikimate kinase